MAVGLAMDEEQDQHPEEVRREGSILKIRMKDFMTYDSVECTPGKSLNVVIGPNGTGKSSILSAIVLGLGGKPTLLGKPLTNIQEFIKNNRQEAQIEIDLSRNNKSGKTTIKRTIFKDGKSIWHLNGRQVAMREIEAETKALNIQIGNLCQVLPQDRVQDFAKLNKRELLLETQKAVGKEEMSEIHTKLKDLQRQQEQLRIQIASDSKKKELEQGQVDRLKGAVEKMERRKGIEAQANAARLKLSIVNYQIKKREMDETRALVKEAEKKRDELSAQIEPFKQQIAEAESKFNTAKNKRQGSERKIKIHFDAVSTLRSKLESIRDEILENEVNLQTQLKNAGLQISKEEEVRQTISKYRNDIASLESLSNDQINFQLKQMELEVNKLAALMSRAETQKLHIDTEIHEGIGELESVNREILRMEDQKNVRMRILNSFDADAYQAARWVDSNRNLFEAPVFLPMIVELDVDPQFARYAENAIGFQDLKAICCESTKDMKVVIDNCRKRMKLNVNVLEVKPNSQPLEPNTSLSDLRRCYPEFQGYLIDFVKGPNTLLKFLCHRKKFHSIPVALSDIEADLQVYYSGDMRKGFSKSKYSDATIHTSDPIGVARFFQAVDKGCDIEELRKKVIQLQELIDTKRKEQNLKKQEMQELRQKREHTRNEQNKIRKTQAIVKNLKFLQSQKEKELLNMQRNRQDPEAVTSAFKAKVQEAALKLVAAQEPFYQALKKLDLVVVESTLFEFELQAANTQCNLIKRLSRAEQEAHENAKQEVEVIRNRFLIMKTEVTNVLKSIERKNGKKLLEIWQDPDNQRIFPTLPDSAEELEYLIEDKTAHAEMLGGGNDTDVVRQFQNHVRQLETLTTSISDNEIQAAQLIEDMERRENQWKTELNDLVDTISSNFANYFKEMGCAGEVVLFTGNSEHDYENYGLRVRVKFRDSEDLQDLNEHTQSGGERAVSTAIYMLSLQGLTPAPFRLVDEINQGMDSKNERRVYNLLMRSTSRPGTPQYFLLTPKLLKDMEYGQSTTVLCVMNSACAPDHRSWNIHSFIKLRQQQGSNCRFKPSSNNNMGDD